MTHEIRQSSRICYGSVSESVFFFFVFSVSEVIARVADAGSFNPAVNAPLL